MNARVLTLLMGLVCLGTASAAEQLDPAVYTEHAVETTSTATSIATAFGALAARSCLDCPSRFVSLTSESKFYVGRSPVPFADFKALANDTRSRSMTIYYRAADNIVTRVVISAD